MTDPITPEAQMLALAGDMDLLAHRTTRPALKAMFASTAELIRAHAEQAEQLDAARRNSYPHMCRDEHPQIGHSDSEHEMCPLCRERALARTLAGALEVISDWPEPALPTTADAMREVADTALTAARAAGLLGETQHG